MHRIAVATVALGVGVLASCLAPTETTLVLSTDVDCSARKPSTAIYTGAVHDTDPSSPRTVTPQCAPVGKIGTLVVVPEDLGEFQVDVVTALDGTDPTTCPSHPERCITSRRRVTSLKHTPLTLPIENDLDCLGVSCDPASTCYRGRCVSATVDSAACASPEGCSPDGAGAARPSTNDAAAPDAAGVTVPDNVTPDAAPGTTGRDGSAPEAGGWLPEGGGSPDAGLPETGGAPDAAMEAGVAIDAA